MMAMAMDRSKYRNPDMPVGYEKKNPELRYKEGVEIDGYHYIWAPYLYDAHIDERDDYDKLSELILSSDEETLMDNNEVIVEETVSSESVVESLSNIKKESEIEEVEEIQEESVEFGGAKKKILKHEKKSDSCMIALSKIKKDKEIITIKEESVEFGGAKKKILKHSKRDDDCEKHAKKKKLKKPKKDRKSDSSSPSRSPSRHRSPCRRHRSSSSRRHYSPYGKIVTYSPSPSPPPPPPLPPSPSPPPPPPSQSELSFDFKIKEEPLDQPQHLFGSYHCEVCNITMNSLLTYETHVNGKRHRKNMKVKNVSEVAAQTIPATVISEDQSKYPKPPSGVIRRKVNKPAEIQHIIENNIKIPCPGLDLVTEIQGISGTQYYCSMCDSVCSSSSIMPHITGFKHQLKSIKEFKPGVYEQMQDEPKYKIEKEILNILRAVQRREGMGRMAVEVEELISDQGGSYSGIQASSSRDYISLPSTSKGAAKSSPAMSFHDVYDRAAIPNKSSSDFFCEICQSHMNSLGMWEAHIRGKRHLTNLKKMPGDLPSKTKTVLVRNKRAFLLDRLKEECPDEPIVGLQEVRETEIPETRSHSYQCFLCGSCHTSLDIIEHLISLKHRTKYLDHIDFPGREVTFGMSDIIAYDLVKSMCAEVEATEGTGNPAVHVNKSSLLYR